jgi:diguanylate cyclase (GGDEF)-like protein
LEDNFPILIAEDNPVSRKLIEKALIKAGHKVVSVEDGRKALELFNKSFFPIVLTDWVMPEMDGVELCQAIRQTDTPGYVYIVLLTANDSKDDIVTGLKAGADDYLTKPFNHAELIARLNTGKRILDLERSLKEANEEIRILSVTDPLTGCYNRSYLNERLPQEINRARRYKHPLSLILSDIDHFKKVNDTYGHLVGDHVLKEFVKCFMEVIRYNVDWVGRYGGEEFLIVLPETDLKSATRLAERLRSNLSQRVIEIQGKQISITASFGITGFDPTTPDEKISPEALINEADEFMYQAKEEGRNRVRGNPI